MISCGRLQNESAVMQFIDCTLMRVQHDPVAVSVSQIYSGPVLSTSETSYFA